jgi:hypothetical protein
MVENGDSATVRLGTLIEGAGGRGLYLFMILFSLPFVSPIPLPALSNVFGVAVTIVSFRLAFRLPPRLPSFLRNRQISRERMEKFLRRTAATLRAVEKVVKPRYGGWMELRTARFINAMLLALMGIMLALPLPPVLPFSHSLPCWAIILIALAVMERDGILIWLGYAMAIVTFVYMVFFTGVVLIGIHTLFDWLRSLIAA